MIAIEGIYQNGQVFLQEQVDALEPSKVIVTFLEQEPVIHPQQLQLITNLYRNGNITLNQAQALLNQATWQQTAQLLEQQGCQLHYDEDDWADDLQTVSSLESSKEL